MKTAFTRKEAMDHLMAYLNNLEPGVEFAPHEVAQALSGESGKSNSWYRMIVATDLIALGLVEFNVETTRYRVVQTA